MRFGLINRWIVLIGVLLLAAGAGSAAKAQTATGTLRGQVTDPSGAAIANATVLVTTAAVANTSTTNKPTLSF